ncbi:hypothetical protein VTJ49DRAFT_3335 [Mycothermus thermophilus]|uniref:Uncharacterized protein n=1 Tax=Humicola insolens TaxID=85995 RepID=A0ABR3VML4_HUMIN
MSTSPDPGPVNGHASPSADDRSMHTYDSNLSDAEHSTVNASGPIIDAASPAESPDAEGSPDPGAEYSPGDQQEEPMESSSSEHDAEDDGDFEAAGSPASNESDDNASDRASSAPTRTAPKRKAPLITEEDYIRENPELYGLRRSSRPTQRRKLVESDDDDDDDDESDASPAPRKAANKRRRIERSVPTSKRATPARQPSFDDSDSDTYGGAKARSFQKKARRQQQLDPTLMAEKRWSNRRAAQVSAGMYHESDMDDDEEDDATPGYWAAAEVEDNSPYIEKILRHRPKEGVELSPDATRHDFEYYIKWQGKSHLHNTWETTESVAGFRGFRRLENYYKKMVEYELDIKFGGDEITPEQREQWLLDREREEEALEDYTKVERVVAVREGENGLEYFVKWKGLQYDDCTWEDADQISSLAQDKIDQFLDRSTRSWQSDKKQMNIETRSRMTKLEKQPSYIKNGELREFQMIGLNFLALNWTRNNNVILADEMGLGKTVQTVSFLSWLRNDRGQEGPFLVVAPLSVIPAWCDTFNHWAPDLNYVVYLGPEAARANIREYELFIDGNPRKTKFNVLVTSYEYILADSDFLKNIKWQVLAVDEAHRLKNRESQLYVKLNGFGIPSKILITGTPIQNNLAELSALMDFLNPGKILIDEELELLSADTKDGSNVEMDDEKRLRTQQKLSELHAAIKPFILRRTKEKVESDLPPKTEKIIRVELSDLQLEYYKNILTRNYAALTDASNGHKQSLLNIMMELKKVSNHPYMFVGAEERVLAGSTRREDQIKGLITSSGKMMLLDQLLAKLKKDGHRVLIFSQMVKMLDILGDYLRVRGYQFQRLDGTIPAGPRRMAINHFNAEGSEDFCFLLSTRAGGLGINLMTADTVIIYDSDWNPQADLQAMARAHRIGQKKPVNVYRLVAKQTIEEEVVKRARNKLFLEYLTIQAGVTDEGKALREQFKQRGLKIDEAKTAEDISMILKMRSQDLFSQSSNQQKLEQLDIDAILENAEVTKTEMDDKINLSTGGIDWDNWMQVTDVKVDELALDWDQIIPADELAAIKAEEEKKKHEEYLAKAMEESAPRKATLKITNKKATAENERAERLEKKRQRERREMEEREEARAAAQDPRRPLNEKETRNLIRAFFRYGNFEDREDEIVHDARLTDRDRDFLKSVIDELVAVSRQAIDANNEKLREEEERAGKPLAKKDKKAVLVDFGEVRKINAETVVERPPQLKLLRRVLAEQDDVLSFRLPDASKAAQYTCEWGAREDAMLLIGIDKYGFGAWTQIRDDPQLQMQDKFFLEEHRVDKREERRRAEDKGIQSPGAVHLVRRSEYLLSVLMAKYSNDENAKKAVENHHRSKKLLTNGLRRGEGSSVSASPAPMAKKTSQHRDRDHHRSYSNANDRGTPRPDKRKYDDYDNRDSKHRRIEGDSKQQEKHKEKEKHKMDPETMEKCKRERQKACERFRELCKLRDDEIDLSDNKQLVWSVLRPLRSNMERIMYSKEDYPAAKERAKILGEEIRTFGNFLKNLQTDSGTDMASLEPQFWEFLSSIWPLGDVKVSGKRLQRMFGDLMERDRKERLKEEEERRARAKNPDLEDGEIPSDREEFRRQQRDPYRDDRREERREERRSDERRGVGLDDRNREEPKRRNYYDDGDRLNFYRHRRPDNRNVPVRHSSWQSRSPPARQSPY